MINKIMVILTFTLSACGSSPAGVDGGAGASPSPTNPYANLVDGVHVLSFTCSNTTTLELSSTPSAKTLKGIIGSTDNGHPTNPTAATCQLKVVSVKSSAGRPYDVIITQGQPTSVVNGHAWSYTSYPLCVGSIDLSSTASCASVGIPQTDSSGVATIGVAIDSSHTWNGVINLKSTLKHNEDGNSYTGTDQGFAIISGYNTTWVNNNGIICTDAGFGSCSSGAYPGFTNLVAPANFTCQTLSGYGEDFRNMTSEPVCQPI